MWIQLTEKEEINDHVLIDDLISLDSEAETSETLTELDILDSVKNKNNIAMNCDEDEDDEDGKDHDAEINKPSYDEMLIPFETIRRGLQFEENTPEGGFGALKGCETNVPMMHIREHFPFALFPDFKALELPYKGGNVSMLILLPHKRDGLQALEESLTPEKLAEVQERIKPFEIPISLPKFKLEFERELSGPLQALGANQIFSAGADFSGMTPGRGVSVSQVLHKAVIEVNEEGSEAAAVTGVVAYGGLSFRADHPFLFTIVEKGSRSNMVLFMGRVNNF
ncbi:Serpin B4 [Araneus ventricosus]|uniref:Serpin B4 n=1 Tax=Araneus ventricosus TaxID=182803 RepID=A0A4Y2VIV9_ARAVE|nr:Serpin B4 [Araneus ventricosus]